ncbi:WD40 repeat-like protein [Hymenopellis radicata]|nr:WD40 repeat-like protein [Hymenopellis radicata]
MLRYRWTKRFPFLGSRKERKHENATASVSNVGSGSTSVSGNNTESATSEIPSKAAASVLAIHVGLNGLHEALKVVNEAAEVFGPLKSVIGGLLACIEVYQRTLANHEEMERVIKTIDHLASLVTVRLERLGATNASRKRMLKLESDLKNIVKNIEDLQARGFVVRLAENSVDAGKLVGAYQQIKDVLNAFQLEVGLEIEQNVQDILNEVVIRDLRRSRDASFRAAIKTDTLSRGPCTAGTRVEILDKIMAWARADDSPPVFWLTGLAGTGKTTIAYTISERMWAENKLLVSFFCSRQLDSKDSRLIVPTICRNLAELFRSYATKLVPVLQGDSVLGEARIREQVDKLLAGPWSASLPGRDGLPVPVVVIDALDESDDGIEFLKNLLRVVGDKSLRGIKFLVTSRAQPEIVDLCHSFQLPADMICCLHEVPLVDVQDDIAQFLTEKLPELCDTDEFTQITRRAGGLFIFAATAVRFISPPHRTLSHDEQREKLQKLLKPGRPSGSTLLLDQLYEQVLSAAFDEEDEEFLHRRLDILHAVVCAQDLISIPVIAQLLGLNEDTTKTCVDSLHSVLYVSSSLVLCYHASFPEFILDAQRSRFPAPLSSTKEKSRQLQVFCDKPIFNARLAHHCFRIMGSELCFNICHLPSSFMLDHEVDDLHDLVQTNISPVLRYAACNWAEHLLAAGRTNRLSLYDDLKAFLTDVFLFWLEAMNLIGSQWSLCVHLFQQACTWLKFKAGLSNRSALLNDAASFTRSFTQSPASQSTPHLYISCLSTWSSSAPISKIWKPRFKHLPLFSPEPVYADPLLTIETFTETVAFSPDDLNLASAVFTMSLSPTPQRSIQIWDSTTGELHQELVGHTKRITSVSFSDDGAYIVSASEDMSICIWDTSTGKQLRELLGHTGSVEVVAFSHDTQYIVSGSKDMSIHIWARDPKVSDQLKQLDGHTDWVQCAVFSHDDMQVVSGSKDGSVRIWDVKAGQQVRELTGHDNWICAVMFSPCGSQIMSGSYDGSLRIWDVSTGKALKQFDTDETYDVSSVAFSRDGQKIVSGSTLPYNVRICDVTTGKLLKVLRDHCDNIQSVMFSHDGTRVVSASGWTDQSIHVWMASERRPEELKGHTLQVRWVAFSSDGERVISVSGDKTIRVWDAATGRQLKKFKYALEYCDILAFSSDGALVACSAAAKDGGPLLRIWDTASGKLATEQYIGEEVGCLSFSPDSTCIVTGLESGSLIIWNSRTGEKLLHLKGHTESRVTSVAFFPDGFQLVSGSSDSSIRIWDTKNGENVHVLTGHTEGVTSVAVSVGGEKIVSGSWDGSVVVWDAETGERVKEIHLALKVWNHACSVAFSPRVEHPQIVAGLDDGTVRVWDQTTGKLVKVLRGHTDWVDFCGIFTRRDTYCLWFI